VQIKSLNRVRDIRDQLSQLCERIEIEPESLPDTSDVSPIQKSILAGYFFNAAQLSRTGDSYKPIKAGGGPSVYIHPSSCVCSVSQ
jgi:pre-mRNA-splicing factor ATP-dependent RNA helicase DHX16